MFTSVCSDGRVLIYSFTVSDCFLGIEVGGCAVRTRTIFGEMLGLCR